MTGDDLRYGIGDLAALGGVSRRTVRYYVQEGLIPAPFGLGRGDHYGPVHLERLRQVKALQEAGCTLDDVRRELQHGRPSGRRATGGDGRGAPAASTDVQSPSTWHRVVIAPGVELHVDRAVGVPSPTALRELADWCQRHLGITVSRPVDKEH